MSTTLKSRIFHEKDHKEGSIRVAQHNKSKEVIDQCLSKLVDINIDSIQSISDHE